MASPNNEAFDALCQLMDSTPFARNPYRGILTRVAGQFDFKGGRKSVFQAIKIHRNPEVMMAVARAIREVEGQIMVSLAATHDSASTDTISDIEHG